MLIESRCGILCSECPDGKAMGCIGCANLEKPFWGDCPVKICCESKEQEHCGTCSEFPCSLLNEFAYDKEHGDDGKRIEQCRTWCTCTKKIS